MTKFDAGTAVDAMEYDFSAYGGSVGVVPEPSDEILDEFFVRLADVMGSLGETTEAFQNIDTTNAGAVGEALASVDGDVFQGVSGQITDLLAFLTQGKPSAEDLTGFPSG